jgi:acetylornithine/N-succinyldiaminopimelate aminotransferase
LFKQRLAEVKDRHPRIIAEVRGEGLLVGLKMAVPNTEMTAALLKQQMLAVGAGDNVVRLLPPLIIDETIIGDAISRIDRACSQIEADMGLTQKKAVGA